MNGQGGWYADRQGPYAPYPGQPQQQQQYAQLHQNQQQVIPDQQYMQHGSGGYSGAPAQSMAQASYGGMFNLAQSPSYASTSSAGASTHLAPGNTAPGGNYGQQHPNASTRRQSIDPRAGGGISQAHHNGHIVQGSSYLQQHLAQQAFNGGQMAAPHQSPGMGPAHASSQAWQYTHFGSPVQSRLQAQVGLSHQSQMAYNQNFGSSPSQATPRHQLHAPHLSSQYGIESPYAPSPDTRDRLAMSQSPMSDVFQSGRPPPGRTFNLMTGLETPTPAPPSRRISAQSNFEPPVQPNFADPRPNHNVPTGNAASNGEIGSSPMVGQWHANANHNAQQNQHWPAGQSSSSSDSSAQVGHRNASFSADGSKPYSGNAQPGLVHANAVSPSQRNFATSSLHPASHPSIAQAQAAVRREYSSAAPAAPPYPSGSAHPTHSTARPPSSTGSSLDAVWGALPPRSSVPSQAAMSSQYMPRMNEPGSPSLLVAKNHSLGSRQHVHPPVQSLPAASSSSTLDFAMSAHPKGQVSKLINASSNPVESLSARSEPPLEPVRPKPVKRKSKPKTEAAPPHNATHQVAMLAPNEPRPAMAASTAIRDGALPQYASPSQLFARPPPSTARPPSEEPQTPPPPASHFLAVQESPDPLNLLSPNGHFSLWQHPSAPSHFHPPHHPAPLQQGATMPRAPSASSVSSSKRKDPSTADDKPKKKRAKKSKEEPAFNLKVDELSEGTPYIDLTSAETSPSKPKKPKKKDKPLVKLEHSDPSRLPELTVDLPGPSHDDPLDSQWASSSGFPDGYAGHKEAKSKKKKIKRPRKSFSELVHEIVENSDSGADAEGSDWDELEILETWDASMPADDETASEGPRSLAKMSNGPVKTSQRKMPLAKLRGLIEDLFEADDSLPDRDSLQDLLPGQSLSAAADQFFELIDSPSASGGSRSVLVLRAAALQRLLKLIVKCSRTNAEIASKAQAASNPGISTIPAADLTRLLAVLERTARIGEDLDPFPSQVKMIASEPSSPTKPKKGRKAGRTEASPSKTPEPSAGDAAGAVEAQGNGDDDTRGQGQESGSADEELERLNVTFAVIDRAVLAAECSLGILTGDVVPKQILSEDHIRACFEAVKTCLDKVILPFIEACSGSAATAPHPALGSLINVLAPQKARKKKAISGPGDETTSSIGIICRNTLSDLFTHLCSALFFVQRMVRMPSIALSDSIVISAVYLAMGPFFVLEPEPASGGATSENAKAAARGRSALLSLGGANSMKTLRLPALNLLRSIFAKSPDQRQWMIEEILTSLTKLTDMKKNRRQYSLRNGKGIHSINALLMQLIQAASHGVASYARSTADRISKRKEGSDGDNDAAAEAGPEHGPIFEVVIGAFNATNEPDSNDAREAEIAIWRRGLEGANQAARSIAAYLMQRIGQTKVAKSSQEMSHAYVIESLIQDMLSALFLPEWPAAALMLSAFCRVFGSTLEDPKAHPDAKGVALEQLSLVASRLRQSQLQLQPSRAEEAGERRNSNGTVNAGLGESEPSSPSKSQKWTTWDYLSMLRALREGDRHAIKEYVQAYKFISRFLAKSANEDMSTEGALEYLLVQAEGELATAWFKADEDIHALSDSLDDSAVQIAKLQHFREELDAAMLSLSDLDPTLADASLTAFTSDEKMLDKAIDFSERALVASSSMISYNVLRDLLVEGLNNPLIGNRTKALRGIDRIAQVDPDLLDDPAMRSAIEVRLRDSSNAVRDSAVALFGSYLLRKPQHLAEYYPKLAVRVADTGLSVRKRMVRLLKSMHEATDDHKIRIDSCARIIRCINDEDTLVQDMVVLTIGEMWLDMDIDTRRLNTRRRGSPLTTSTPAQQQADATNSTNEDSATTQPVAADETGAQASVDQPVEDDTVEETEASKKVADTIETIMAVANVIRERPSPLEEVFRRLFKDKSESEAAELHAKLQRLGDSMIDSLVESSGSSNVDTVKRIRIVQLLVSTNPAILTISKAKLLLPYLKAAQTGEEVQIMGLLLRIFRSCLPHMPKTALAFAQALENSLRPLVNRPPPKAGLHLLQELIACYCAVITTHTHNFRLLIQTLKACFIRVQAMRQGALKGKKVEENKAWSTLMSLTASLCEHADFDEIRKKRPEIAPDIDAISKRPLVDVVSEALLDIHKTGSEAVRSVALQNLGFIFRAHPTLMTRPSLTSMMDSIFASGSLQDRATLLKIILDFLNADSSRRDPDKVVVNMGTGHRKPENPDAGSVDMTVLVGNTESFADTGVGSAMMQRYSEDVLKATLQVSNPSLQRTAIDILRFTVLQGLSHPIQCVPYLVSLETLEDRKIRSRAMELHSHVASKHGSLVHARYLDTARSAFRFQLELVTAQTLRGYRMESMPIAVLDAWYSLLRDRRALRIDFLRQIVKALDVNTAASDCSMQEVLFARFIADNLATLDYKTMEELFVVIGELRSILAVSGMQVLYMTQPHLPHQDAVVAPSASTPTHQEGTRTPPPQGTAIPGSAEFVSPFQLSRNPWLSGEWQLELADDGSQSFHGTIDPMQIFGQPLPTPGSSMSTAPTTLAPPSQATDAMEKDKDKDDEAAKAQVDAVTVARMSVISGTALLLRNHLKQLYGLSEARCAKFNPSKKQSAGADKPATMRAVSDPMQAALDLSAMPFGLEKVMSEEDAKKQMMAYAAMVENEGTMMEPEDADALDDLAL